MSTGSLAGSTNQHLQKYRFTNIDVLVNRLRLQLCRINHTVKVRLLDCVNGVLVRDSVTL